LTGFVYECKNKNIEFTFISSWFVYGETDLPATESSICKPKGFYSITKYAAELLLESYCKTFNIKYKIIRLGNVLGNSDGKISKKKNALQFLISEIKENKDINLYNNGNFYRDFIHVSDVAKGIKYVMERGNFNEIYNLGCGIPIVFKSIIDYAVEKTNSTLTERFEKFAAEPSTSSVATQKKELSRTATKAERAKYFGSI
jgi:nucleoside-diphosphate-sugar epimerase